MVTRSVLKYVRISPRKFRLIVPLVKGKNPEQAIAILGAVKKKASEYAIAILKTAIANTKKMQGVSVSDLYISKLTSDPGPTLKRFRAGSMGRAGKILKRTSHITVELDMVKHPAHEAKGAAAQKAKKEVKTDKPQAHTHEHADKKAKAKPAVKHEHGKKTAGA